MGECALCAFPILVYCAVSTGGADMTPADRLITEWIDARGGFIRAGNWAAIGGSPATVFAAMVAASNAVIANQTQGQPFQDLSAPVDALYPTVQDTLQLTCITAALTYTQVVIPAPIAALFQTGSVNVDFSSAAFTALQTALVGNITDQAGSPVTAISAAVKSQRRIDYIG
jgi:hypothetical protein